MFPSKTWAGSGGPNARWKAWSYPSGGRTSTGGGTKAIKGVLFYGPPGTGKTLLVKALAREAEAVFVHLQMRSIAFKWPMQAGDLLQELFTAIRGNEGVVLYLEELDALAFERIFGTEEARGASRQAINALLENLDGLDAYEHAVVVASTNQSDAVDPALIGPGRFDRLIEVPLPDGEEKQEILQIHQRKAEALAGRCSSRSISTPLWREPSR